MPLHALIRLAVDHGHAAAANELGGVDISIVWTMGNKSGVDVINCRNLKELMWAMGY